MIVYRTELDENKIPYVVQERKVHYGITPHPDSVTEMLNTVVRLGHLAEEHIYEVCLSSASEPIGIFEVGQGSLSAAPVSPLVIFRNALLLNAPAVIIAHNHPSGSLEASFEDLECRDRLKNAGELLGVKLLDFLVLSGVAFSSLM